MSSVDAVRVLYHSSEDTSGEVRSGENYIRLHKVLCEKEFLVKGEWRLLSPVERIVMATIFDGYAIGEEEDCRSGYTINKAELARKCGCTRRTIYKALDSLVSVGFIEVVPHGGGQSSDIYVTSKYGQALKGQIGRNAEEETHNAE